MKTKEIQDYSKAKLDFQIDQFLHLFQKVPRMKKGNCPTDRGSQKDEQSQLYDLAKMVLAIPVTKVTVERLFSNLKFILSHYERISKKIC